MFVKMGKVSSCAVLAVVLAAGVSWAEMNPINRVPQGCETKDSTARALTTLAVPAIISNGTVQLGVNPLGNLDVPGGTPSSGYGTTVVGLRYVPTNADATAPGCQCEGWGVADNVSKVTGYANNSAGTAGLTEVSFVSDSISATSVVDVGTTFRVTHKYQPSISPNLYEVYVTIENISAANTEVLYRRVFDFDVEPTYFDEYITIQKGDSPNLVFTSNNGFASANPLVAAGDISGYTGSFVDAGPLDHGAVFDFNFGTLAPGASVSFRTFYGAAANESQMLDALGMVRTEAYSLGQPSSSDPKVGTPNTFAFAFSGVGGSALPVGKNYVATALIADVNGNGSPEMLGLTVNATGAPVVVMKDTSTNAVIRNIVFFGSAFTPIDVAALGNNIAVLAQNRTTGAFLGQVRTKTGALLYSTKPSLTFPKL